MTQITLNELTLLMRDGSGVDESIDLSGEISDVPFGQLGYDSLAVMELVAGIERTHAVRIPDTAIAEMTTPQRALDYINDRLLAAP